ncbi:MAG TPA: PAS domain-containing protein [Rhizomicrobium sp.]|nr:PAS domain-containing protein [Rhizomicrobium sp.]
MDQLSDEGCRPLDPESVYPGNRHVLAYWQSLRAGRALPSRAHFDPSRVSRSLSRLMVVQVWPGERIVCRLAGTAIVHMVGMELTGSDIVANTPPEFRRERLARYSNCMDGFLHRAERMPLGASGAAIRAEHLILPFADLREDGSRLALLTADWVAPFDEQFMSAASAFDAPDVSEYIALR